ncbi:riboflavin synthase subunit alpha [Thalassotalea sediminis]|uniref:riboflavin synthase subunit alpha n=1 Tax=Thalassotalea sediminis TaxID=1759089 RepID=UPI00257244AF|nr:riboflavin synthase subunit alpha [Thalassotalea sediminis]
MFTGIVQSQAEIISANVNNALMRLVVSGDVLLVDRLAKGASIAVNGCCLTVVDFYKQQDKSVIEFDVIDETLRLTNLGTLTVGEFVNIERSLKMGDELGGHIVSGHIHGTAKVNNISQTPTNCQITFEMDTAWKKYVLEKGFITINGISLTVGNITDNQFNVHLIPETLARTNLAYLTTESYVNIECDQQTITIVNTIERMKITTN